MIHAKFIDHRTSGSGEEGKLISNDQEVMPIRTKSPPSKPKSEISKITISQNTKRSYDKPIEQLSPKRWPFSYLNLTKYHLDTQKVKTLQKLTPKQANIENQVRSAALERSVI